MTTFFTSSFDGARGWWAHTSRARLSFAALSTVVTTGLAQGPPPGYYDSTSGLTGEALRLELHEIVDDHQRYPYTSTATDTWDILELADEDAANSSNVLTIYKN